MSFWGNVLAVVDWIYDFEYVRAFGRDFDFLIRIVLLVVYTHLIFISVA